MQWQDTQNTYGWISILAHWLSALLILALWFTGDSSQSQRLDTSAFLSLHVSLALSVYVLLWARIAWRICVPHPRVSRQKLFSRRAALLLHFLILLCMICMLVSGPIVALGSLNEIRLFGSYILDTGIVFPGEIYEIARAVHGYFATLLLLTISIHIAAAFKHLMFNDDDTFVRILVPPRKANKR